MSRRLEVGSMRCWLEFSLLCGKEILISLKKTSLLGTLGLRNTSETAARWSGSDHSDCGIRARQRQDGRAVITQCAPQSMMDRL